MELAFGERYLPPILPSTGELVYTGIVDLHANSALLRNPASCISGFACLRLWVECAPPRAPRLQGADGGRPVARASDHGGIVRTCLTGKPPEGLYFFGPRG